MSDESIYKRQPYYALALDPLHVGVGGYRLGRVDLSIIREPGDNLPKIPGSSLSGVARANTALKHNKPCAGKGGATGDEHCGQPDCPVCVSFGFSKGRAQQSLQGMAQFFDAHVLFFPVYSMVGPVWITSPVTLSRAGLSAPPEIVGGQVRLANTLQPAGHRLERLNLGWLLLPAGTDLAEADISNIRTLCDLPAEAPAIKEILGRLVLLPDELFSKVVNDNLEVRTSVSIDPATGAAEDKALFTYEALPRATVLYFDVVYNNPQHFQIGSEPIPHDISWVKENVEEGLALMQYLGVGGMNTRGMGRLQVLNLGRG